MTNAPVEAGLGPKSNRCSFSTPIIDRRSPDILWPEIECVHPAGIPTRRPSRKRERMRDAGGGGVEGRGKKRCAYGRVKKRGRNVEMQTDGVLRSSLVSRLRKLPEESYQEPFSPAGRSPHARSLPTLSTNGYL